MPASPEQLNNGSTQSDKHQGMVQQQQQHQHQQQQHRQHSAGSHWQAIERGNSHATGRKDEGRNSSSGTRASLDDMAQLARRISDDPADAKPRRQQDASGYPTARRPAYSPPNVRIQTHMPARLQKRPGAPLSLKITTSLKNSATSPSLASASIVEPASAVLHSPNNNDLSPLSPMEERVFENSLRGSISNQPNYSVFNDETVMKMCDDEVDQAAAAIAAENAHQATTSHGWRIDSVIDKYGNRIASRSKRLARMMGQRNKNHTPNTADPWPLLPKPGINDAPVSSALSSHHVHYGLRHESSSNASSTYSSPMGGALAELHDSFGRSAAAPGSNSSPRQKQLAHRRSGAAGKSRPHLNPQQRKFKRRHGSSMDSILARGTAMSLANTDDNVATGNGADTASNDGNHAMAGIDSVSFELVDYSTGGSTSTILQKRSPDSSKTSNSSDNRFRHWWSTMFHRPKASANPAQHTSAQLTNAATPPVEILQKLPRGMGAVSPSAGGFPGAFEPAPSSRTAEGGSSRGSGYGNSGRALMSSDAQNKPADSPKPAGPFKNAVLKTQKKVTNFIMPGGYNRFGTGDGHTSTGSIGYMLALILASVAFIMWGTLVPKALCTTNQTFTMNDVASRKFVAANGIVSDFALSRSSFGHDMRAFTGSDASTMFPLLGQLSKNNWDQLSHATTRLLSKCIVNNTVVSNFIQRWQQGSTLYRGDLDSFPTICPLPLLPHTNSGPCLTRDWSQFISSKVGLLKVNTTRMHLFHSSPTTSWVIIDGMVFDVSTYVIHASSDTTANGTRLASRQLRPESMFLPESLSSLFIEKPGKDISDEFHSLNIDDVLYKRCMEELFLHGTTQTAKSPFACANTNIVGWVTFGLYFFVLFFRLLTAELYARLRTRKAVLSIAGFEHPFTQSQSDVDDEEEASSNASGHKSKRCLSMISGTGDSILHSQHSRNDSMIVRTPKAASVSKMPPKEDPVAQPPPAVLQSRSDRQLEAGQPAGNRIGSCKEITGRHRTARAPKCIVMVPCAHESADVLSRTFQGIARSTYADTHKLLWIINDGDPETLDSILRIVEHSGRASDPKFYGAYGVDNGTSYGSARVYAGFYECGRHRVPYVVTAKETYQGRVDTLMMVLNFFRSLSNSSRQQRNSEGPSASSYQNQPQQPQTIFLEEEVEARMTMLGHPPTQADYCLMQGGGLQIDPLAITQFIARMERNEGIIALSGALYPVGRPSTLLHILQYYEFYLRHFVSPICESLSKVTCPLNQLFTMYRVRLPSGDFCLGDEDFVASMDSLMKGSIRYRHLTWPGNDCLLVPRIVRRFPQCRWSFEPNGRAEIELTAHEIAAFDPYERQWFRTRLATLFDMLRGRLRKRTWPVMFAHLLFPFVVPAASSMLYLEIVISCFGNSPAIVVSELTAGFVGATLILLLASRKWNLALYFLVYSVIGVPFYHVWIPLTSLLSMNRVWYSPEQIAAQQAAAETQVNQPENFEAMRDRYLRKLSTAAEKRHGRRHKHSTSLLSDDSSIAEQQQQQQQQQHQQRRRQQQQQPHQRPHGGVSGILGGHWRKHHSSSGSGKKVRIRSASGDDGANYSSDSEPEFIENLLNPVPKDPMSAEDNTGSRGYGLGLTLDTSTILSLESTQRQLSNVVVSDPLLLETRTVLRQILQEYPQGVEPESAEFYAVCERALAALIPSCPSSSVTELAVAVDKCIDELTMPAHQPRNSASDTGSHFSTGHKGPKDRHSAGSSISRTAPHSAIQLSASEAPSSTTSVPRPQDPASGANDNGSKSEPTHDLGALAPQSAPVPGIGHRKSTTLPLLAPPPLQQPFMLAQPPPPGGSIRSSKSSAGTSAGRRRPVSVILEEPDTD